MIFLERFVLPRMEDEDRILEIKGCQNGGPHPYIDNSYPCGIFTKNYLTELDFDNITILYGGNGSGKSTLLNLIGKKLNISTITPCNTSETFDLYVKYCNYRMEYDFQDRECEEMILRNSRMIRSDDIFDYMLAARNYNEDIAFKTQEGKEDWLKLKYGETIKFNGLEDYEALRLQVLSRKKSLSRRNFVKKLVGNELKLNSNGETALEFFDKNLKENAIYLLDEPENSLSPKMCLQLKELLEEKARYDNCQLIIATHSPFMLALEKAKIYDLDSTPVDIKNWWELENTKTYFDFFNKNKDLFLKNKN
ncbi:MAG: AAA family ATPase [Clostridia bacterium]|nr:AAA family ATPase [Clostridia bacterium]